MKRFVVFTLLALLALSGFGGGIWADEVEPPPDPGIEDGGAGEPGEDPGGDDNPWGGEERSSGDTNPETGYGLDDDTEGSTTTVVTVYDAADLWTPYFQQLFWFYYNKMKASLDNQIEPKPVVVRTVRKDSRVPDKYGRDQ